MPSSSLHWTDPSASQAIEAPAGATLRIGYRVSNDRNRPAHFRAVAEGLPPEWLPDPETMTVGPYDSGEAVFLVTPPAESAEGEYELSVRLFEGDADRWGQARTVRIVLTPPDPEVDRLREEEEARRNAEREAAAQREEARRKAERDQAERREREAAAATTAAVAAAAAKAVPIEAPKPETPKAEVPKPEAEAVVAEAVAAEVKPKEAPKKKAEAKPKEVPKPEPEIRIRDFEPEKPKEPVAPPKPAADRTVVDPIDGQVLAIRPGETVVVKVSFKNEKGTRATRTFVIQENRALPRDWIETERDQATVTAGGGGFVSIRLKPPLGAEPASYPFLIETGPIGEPLEPRSLILEVLPIPAVALACEKPSAVVWFRRDADFDLSVSVAGNSDTAYRLLPLADPDGPAPTPGAVRPIAPAVGLWRRLVERELGNLASPVTGRRPGPEKHKVRFRREGTWWWGIQEKHAATLEAVPVTDGLNGGKGGNRVALSAVRRRLLPVPWFVATPIAVVAFLMLSGSPTDLAITNEVAQVNGVSYVIAPSDAKLEGPQTIPVALTWKNALLPAGATRVAGSAKASVVGKNDRLPMSPADYEKRLAYTVGGLMGGPRVEVEALAQRTRGNVLLTINGKEVPHGYSAKTLPNGSRAAEYDVEVPKDGKPVTIDVKNTVPYSKGLRVYFFETKRPGKFAVSGFTPANSDHTELPADQRIPIKMSYKGENDATEVWEIVTTDAAMPMLRIRLKAVDR